MVIQDVQAVVQLDSYLAHKEKRLVVNDRRGECLLFLI